MGVAAFAIGIVLISAGQAGADKVASTAGANTFSGSCKLSGTAVWNPPITNMPRAATQTVHATGICSGTFTGRGGRAHQLNNAPISWQTTEYTTDASCSAETDSGTGAITFQYGTIGFTISESRVAPVAAFTLKGAARGSAAGEANISPNADPVAITQACGGAGLAQAPTEIQTTTTPSITG
jgi:hypothetical protein